MTPYAHPYFDTQPDVYKFSDTSQIGQVAASEGNSSNYRFFRIEPIKWIVLNYNNGFNESSNTKDGLTVGTMKRYELLANYALVAGLSPDRILWKDNSINNYLNNYMFNKMFSPFELQLAKLATIYNNTNEVDSNFDTTGSNNNYLDDGSNSTTQNLYLLSYYEVANTAGPYAGLNRIFENSSDRMTTSTDYAKAHYHYINPTYRSSDWWIRTTDSSNVYFTSTSGFISSHPITTNSIGTRPAMQRCFS